MAKFAPQYNPHKLTFQIRIVLGIVFWGIFVLAALPTLFDCFTRDPFKGPLDVINIACLLLFFALEIIVEYLLYPQAEQKRKDDFIDNSFGSKFSPANSIEYYDNEELQSGLYRAAANLFQNVFFTYNLVKESTIQRIVIPTTVTITIFVFAYYGFKTTPVSITILQILFSSYVLGNLIKHLLLLNRLNVIQDNWIELFQIPDFKTLPNKYQASIYRCWLQYETLLSRIQPDIPERVFKRKNGFLTEEWKKIKSKYQIT